MALCFSNRRRPFTAPLLAAVCCLLADGRADAQEQKPVHSIEAAMAAIRPLHKVISKPGPNDWLAGHPEPGQTFQDYLGCNPVVPDRNRRTIYIQPLGSFTATERKIVQLTAEFMSLFYGVPVAIREDVPLSVIPAKARRTHPSWGDRQILTTYVLDEVLKPAMPKDAAAYIAFTASDLWPGEGWNFVFGQASIRERVGVWSIYRNGDPGADNDSFRQCLVRTMKTAVHETGHMFSMLHCTKYECCMCGSNHMEESDRRPTWFCPECVAKVWFATRTDPLLRYRSLADFCRKQKLTEEADFYEKSADALERLNTVAEQ